VSATVFVTLSLQTNNRLAPLYPDKLMLGMEIRDKVAAYVCERIGEHALLGLLASSCFPSTHAEHSPQAASQQRDCSDAGAWCQAACQSGSQCHATLRTKVVAWLVLQTLVC
jgi:hypothetical protein